MNKVMCYRVNVGFIKISMVKKVFENVLFELSFEGW